MKVIDCKKLEKIKNRLTDDYRQQLENLYNKELLKVFNWFAEHCKNHCLEYIDGMGTRFFMLDGEILDLDIKGDKRINFLKPLADFLESINDETNTFDYATVADDTSYHPDNGIASGRADFMGRKRTYRDFYLVY